MHYVFQFGVVRDNWQVLAEGAAATLWMSVAALAFGLLIAVACT